LGIYHEAQRGSPRVVCRVEEEHEKEHEKKDQDTPFRQRRRACKRFFPTTMRRQNGVAETMNRTLLENI